MGAELLEDREIAELADRCSAHAGVDLTYLLTEAGDDELRLTTNAQPALLFTGVALARLLRRTGVEAAAASGHSVGEYTALCVAGSLEPEEAVRAVVERGRAMAEAAPPGTSSMSAVLGLEVRKLESALASLREVWPANYNTPSQTVIGGTMRGLEQGAEVLQRAGARRILPLNVAAAFHTPLMEPASVALREALRPIAWRTPSIPVVANLTGEPYPDVSAVPGSLERQLSSPVRWGDCVRSLRELGCETFIELGPNRALTGMMRELVPDSRATAIATPAAIPELELV